MRGAIGSQKRNSRSISFGTASQAPSTPTSNIAPSTGTQEKSSNSTTRSTDDALVTKSGRPRVPYATAESIRITTHSPGELSPSEEIEWSAMRMPTNGKLVSSSVPTHGAGEPPGHVPEGESRTMTLDRNALARIREGTPSDFKLDQAGPARLPEKRRSARESSQDVSGPEKEDGPDDDGIVRHDMAEPVPDEVAQVLEACGPTNEDQAKVGSFFEVEWVKTGVLPFHRLRHLRNPWNQDKEVKVSWNGGT
jgi:hypothetical protein